MSFFMMFLSPFFHRSAIIDLLLLIVIIAKRNLFIKEEETNKKKSHECYYATNILEFKRKTTSNTEYTAYCIILIKKLLRRLCFIQSIESIFFWTRVSRYHELLFRSIYLHYKLIWKLYYAVNSALFCIISRNNFF